MARKTWVGILSDFVRENPRTSAMIAFNLGVWAAQATRKSLGRTDLTELPSKLIDMVPSMKEMRGYMPSLPAPKTRVTVKVTRRRPRKATARASTKRTSKNGAKSRAGKRQAA